MQYENKILVSAILIIGVALISFNLVNPNISGRIGAGKVACTPGELNAEVVGSWTIVTYEEAPELRAGVDYNGIGDNKFVEYWSGKTRRQQSIPKEELDKSIVTVRIRNPEGNPNVERVAVEDKCVGKIYAFVNK
ncbi:MAG: hypothetical protein AABX08_02345 [Nanoarchaeota archaeon]